ncbi:MAG: two-component regulator propeller domain-containing protein, partial [Anaerolineae bacterium]
GGVARYDGRRWEVFTPENSTLGGRLNYQFFQDDQGRLWFGGGSGAIAGWVNGRWQSHQLADLFEDADQLVKSQQLGQRARFVQDRQGRLWVALGTLFGQFSPTEDFNMPFWQIEPIALQTPQGTAGTLQLDAPVTDMALDANGDLWLATAGDGALRLDTTRPVDAARWEWFTNRNSSLAADDVYTLYADREGNLWFGTTRGLSRLAGTEWTTFDLPGSPVLALQGDAVGQLWAGTSEGAYVWEGSIWEAVDVQLGSVEVFFLDSQGAMWVGTTTGAWRYDGGRWERIILGAPLTMLAQGPAHVIWLGGPMGLLQYDLTTRETVRFDAQNSGMVADWVRDLFVDAEGGLWVSTFQADQLLPGQLAVTTGIQIAEEARKYADANDGRLVSLLRPEQIERIPWAAAGVSALVFGALLALTWRGYELSPATRARRLVASITAQPQTLYPTAYALAADAPQALDQLACYLSDAGNQAGADVLDAMSALISSDNLSDALTTLISALESPLSPLYRLLDAALSAQRVPEIVGLELAVNPTDQVGQVSLGARGHFIKALPPFSPPGSAEAWRALERVGVVLHKYQQVDAAADRLSYLAEALAAAEAAQSSAGRVGLPDGRVLSAIADRWRLAVTHEINAISGQAELRLELRSRQVQRAPQATLVLRLQNTGRAAAENVRVELKLDTEGAEATVLALERLPAGRSTPLEFDVTPAEAETARVLCQVRWDDRVAAGHALDFADVVRFYATDESFHPIPNPYIVGHPIKSATMFWGREDVFRFMAENLKPDRTFILHGQRRTGKTSILYQLLDGRLGPDFIPVLIDMQELALLVNSTGDLLAEMAHHVARAADRAGIASAAPRPEDFDANPTRAFNRFLDALEQDLGHKRVLLMLDEFELLQAKIAQGKLDPDLPGYFRSLLQHRQRLTFIFSGAHRLEEMSQDYWSVLFNVALYHRVSFLSPAEATRLIREPVAGALDVDELAVEKIIRLTNGHPYFVQLLCWALVNHCNAQKHSYATINDVNDVLQEILTAGAAHLAYVWQQAQNAERLALAGLAHTLRPGKPWVRPAEILETLAAEGAKGIEQTALIKTLDALVAQEILQTAQHGALRYRFQLEVLGLWVARTQSIGALVERGGET